LVGLGVLDGVTGFVGGDADGGEGIAVEDGFGEGERAGGGVVVVGEFAWGDVDVDVLEPFFIEDAASGLGTGEAGPCGDGVVAAELGADAGGGPEGDSEFLERGV
jgi:hypothetical protein